MGTSAMSDDDLPPGFVTGAPDGLPTGFVAIPPDLKRVYIGPHDAAGTAEDVGKSAATGLMKGLVSLAGLPGDLTEWGARGIDYAARAAGSLIGQDIPARPPQDAFGGADQIQNAVEGLTGKFHEPQTTAGQYAQTAGEFLPNVLGGPEALATKLATRVAAPALASEGLGQLAKGTVLEGPARIAGAVAGGAGAARALAPRIAPVATAAQLETAAKSAYNHPDVAALELHPSSTNYAAGKITDSLNKSGYRPLTAPQTYSIVQELKTPLGPTAKVADIQSVRTALGKVGDNFSNPTEQAAARKAIRSIDDYLANLKPFDVAAGDASRAAPLLAEARGNWAAKSRLDSLNDIEYRADLNSAAAHSGGNFANATRAAVKNVLLNPAKRRGFSPEEIAQMEQIVRGTFTGNKARVIAKLVSTHGLAGQGTIAGSIAAAPATGGATLALPVVGHIARKMSEASTARAVSELERMVAARSPFALAGPAPVKAGLNPMVSGLLGGATELRNERYGPRK